MDHHCPWIANCVGFYNYKYFFLTVTYSLISLTIFTATFWEAVVVVLNNESNSGLYCFYILMHYSLIAMLNAAILGFWIFHWYLILNGYCTIEFCEKRIRANLYKKGSPYFISYYENAKTALGYRPCLWFIPFGKFYLGEYRAPDDDGTYFYAPNKETIIVEENDETPLEIEDDETPLDSKQD